MFAHDLVACSGGGGFRALHSECRRGRAAAVLTELGRLVQSQFQRVQGALRVGVVRLDVSHIVTQRFERFLSLGHVAEGRNAEFGRVGS